MGTTVEIGTLDGAYIESPAQSGYYTFPEDVHIETPPGSGLYTVGPLTESAPGLYDIPASTFNALGYFSGITSNLLAFSVEEDATTLDPSSYSGGIGQVTIEALEAGNSLLAMSKDLYLENDTSGTIQTIVRDVSTNNGRVTFTADSPLGLLNSYHVVQPQVTYLEQAFAYYLGLAGVTAPMNMDISLRGRPVRYPGWVGNLWDNIKQICSAERIEIASVLDQVVIRPLRTRTATLNRATSLGQSINKQQVAEQVEVYWYNNKAITRGEVYPLPSETDRPTPANVDPGGTTVFTVQLEASLSQVFQPTPINFVEDRSYAGTNGVYSVIAEDNLPVTAEQWTANGGSVQTRITEDPSVIEVTVRGMRNSGAVKGPFRIAMSSGNEYNSLHITGTGVAWEEKKTVIYTGATNAVTGEKVGATVENKFISSYAQAMTAGQETAKAYARTYQITGDVVSVDNQIFGNTTGSRIKTPDANFRIDTLSVNQSGSSFTASEDTTAADFAAVWAGKPATAFSDYWQGKTALEFATTPLRSS